jgi:hypothetical protein
MWLSGKNRGQRQEQKRVPQWGFAQLLAGSSLEAAPSWGFLAGLLTHAIRKERLPIPAGRGSGLLLFQRNYSGGAALEFHQTSLLLERHQERKLI